MESIQSFHQNVMEIAQTLSKLGSSLEDSEIEQYIEKMYVLYENFDHNIRYSIAHASESIRDPEQYDILCTNIETIHEYARKKDKEDKKDKDLNIKPSYAHVVGYFLDYLSLERHHAIQTIETSTILQKEVISYLKSSVKDKVDEIKLEISEEKNNLNRSRKRSIKKFKKEVQSEIRSLDIHSVSVLGIFTAVTFVFSGGFTLLGSALTSIPNISFSTSIFLMSCLCVVGLILIDCLCVIVYSISKFLGKSIWEKPFSYAFIIINVVLFLLAICLLAEYYCLSGEKFLTTFFNLFKF